MSEMGRGIVTKHELELIKKSFMALAGGFNNPPLGGCRQITDLVQQDLGFIYNPRRVEAILYSRFINPKSPDFDPEVKAVADRVILPRESRSKISPGEVEQVKTAFLRRAKLRVDSPIEGTEHLFSLVAQDLGIPIGRVRSIVYTRLCDPFSDEYDETVLALKNSKRQRANCSRDEIELVKLQFLKLGQGFETHPDGVLGVLRLVANDLGITVGRVESLMRRKFCDPGNSFYDQGVFDLHTRLKRKPPLTVESAPEESHSEPEPAETKEECLTMNVLLDLVKSVKGKFNFSELETIFKTMAGRLEAAEKGWKASKEEVVALKKRVSDLEADEAVKKAEVAYIAQYRDRFLPEIEADNNKEERPF